MRSTTRNIVFFFLVFLCIYLLAYLVRLAIPSLTLGGLWVFNRGDDVLVNLVSDAITAAIGAVVVANYERLRNFFAIVTNMRRVDDEQEQSEVDYIHNIEARIRDSEPNWDRYVYTPLQATENRRSGGFQLDMILVSKRLRILRDSHDNQDDYSYIRGRKVDLVGVARKHKRVVLLGEPGTGKSVAVRQIALLACEKARRSNSTRIIPIIVNLRSYTSETPGEPPEDIFDFLQRYLAKEHPHYSAIILENLSKYLSQGRLLVLFDGLNEMPPEDYDERLEKIKKFILLWSRNRFIITCRSFHYDHAFDAQEVVISSLSDEKIYSFLRDHLGTRRGRILFDELQRWDRRAIMRDCRVPYFLKLLLVLWAQDVALPRSRGELFRVFVDHMITKALNDSKERRNPSVDVVMENLSKLAFVMNNEKLLGTEIDLQVAKGAIAKRNADNILRVSREAGIVEITHTGKVRYTHHILQEYFASISIVSMLSLGSDISAYLEDPWWEETISLSAGVMQNPQVLISKIIEKDSANVWNLWLAARCISSSGITSGDETYVRVRSSLITLSNAPGSVFVIARAIRALGELGDKESIQEVSSWLYLSKHQWLQETALATLSISLSDAAKTAIKKFMRSPIAWKKLIPFASYYTRRQNIKTTYLQLILLGVAAVIVIAVYIFSIFIFINYTSTGLSKHAINRPWSQYLFDYINLAMSLSALIGFFAAAAKLLKPAENALSLSFYSLCCVVILNLYGVFSRIIATTDAWFVILISIILAVFIWLSERSVYTLRVLLPSIPPSRREDHIRSLSLSWIGVVGALYFPVAIMLGISIASKTKFLESVMLVIFSLEFTFPLRLLYALSSITILALLLMPLPLAIASIVVQFWNMWFLLKVRILGSSTVLNRSGRFKALREIAIRRDIHEYISLMALNILVREFAFEGAVSVLARLQCGADSQNQQNALWKLIDNVDNRIRRIGQKDVLFEEKLILDSITVNKPVSDSDIDQLVSRNKHDSHFSVLRDIYIYGGYKESVTSKKRIQLLTLAIEADPGNLLLYFRRSLLQLEEGEYIRGIDDIEQYHKISCHQWTWIEFDMFKPIFGKIYQIIAPKIHDARTRRFIRVFDDDIDILLNHMYENTFIWLWNSGKIDKACIWLESGLEKVKDGVDLLGYQVFVLSLQGEFEEAERVLVRIKQTDGESWLYLQRKRSLYYQKGEIKSALSVLIKQISLYPFHKDFYLYLSTYLALIEEQDASIRASEVALRLKPSIVDVGREIARLGDLAKENRENQSLTVVQSHLINAISKRR